MTATSITATTSTTTTSTTRRRIASVAVWTLQVLVAATFAFSAVLKLSAEAQNVAGFEAMGLGMTGMYVLGALELAGAIALFVPRLMGLAALCFVVLMVGAVAITWAMFGAGMIAVPAAVGIASAVLAYARRDSTRALFARGRR